MANWQQYRQFMPDGMQMLFEGKYFWKMPADVEMDVGPTRLHALPPGYLAATKKYASQAKIVTLPDGGLLLKDYVAGIPFPDPQEPHRGWKTLVDVWYRYVPHLIADTPDNPVTLCSQNAYLNMACSKVIFVYRQLRHNTDPGVPMNLPSAGPRDYTEWVMVEEPEQLKYSALLTIFYQDLSHDEDAYAFIPRLRRTLRLSTASRCAPVFGSDFNPDDFRFGFNGNLTKFQAHFLGERKILAMINYNTEPGKFPSSFYMPLGWPRPSWGQWELRDVYVLDVRRIPAHSAGYCYGKRIMYVDKESFAPLWEDLYDSHMRLWKLYFLAPRARMVPGVGVEDVSGSEIVSLWDLINPHATYAIFTDPQGHDVLINGQVPAQYHNIERYGTPGGLDEIMR